ncbi:MAG: mechanosensitive ion channel family protein [Waddliaceae bacterium]|jgi:MscS family membrane protein|nr:mechanosensitive ion channel family protein [Waddliaceae bacterium]MBT3578951.1 mechanosensitive ion channel family protein [Waddliaceae bacterium]MBT4445490.1 mechanosensitive ion channel family protein [Waddliaceae bacterium]MBT6928981.1 mechanosensitive ion channel family protein [Waddliaceae bacterium]MBT7264523.1 mechanosensitive ion channel family protein [Waddliaceae bacterium]
MSFFQEYTWALNAAIAVVVVIFANIALKIILQRVGKSLKARKHGSSSDIFIAIRSPLYCLIWIFTLLYIADVMAYNILGFSVLKPESKLLHVIVIVIVTWFILRIIGLTRKRFARKARKSSDRHMVHTTGRLISIVVIIIAGLIILETLGGKLSTVLAFGGLGGIVIGFAAKDIVANFFGSIVIHITNPFSVGDFIESPDRDIQGHVKEIGWYQTKIMPHRKQPIYVPNSLFSTIIITNVERMTHRFIDETIGVRYNDFTKVQGIVKEIREHLNKSANFDTEQPTFVTFTHFGESSLDLWVSCYTVTTDKAEYYDEKQKLLLKIGKIIGDHGAEIAFPTTTIEVPNGFFSDQ